jgi:hypothetical protein
VVHHKKTYVAIKQHKGKVTGAVVVDDTSVFVGKGTKTKYIAMDSSLISSMKVGRGSSSSSLSESSGMRPGMKG